MIAYELRRQYPEMEVSVFEMKSVTKFVEKHFLPGNEHLGVKFVSGQNPARQDPNQGTSVNNTI